MAESTSRRPRKVEGALGTRLPARYAAGWFEQFEARFRPVFKPGLRILDVGSGRKPALALDQRPEGCFYVGLDVSQRELELAPEGSYDETFCSDIAVQIPALYRGFDLILSWQVLEHVAPLDAVLENLRIYLRPGGRMVALLSGGLSAFGVVNRVVPARLGVWALEHLTGRDPDTVFPAHYDRCYYTALNGMLKLWSTAEVLPLFRGASYFRFSRVLQGAYLRYENWAARSGRRNLATHYLLVAER